MSAGLHSPETRAMNYDDFLWTRASERRNALTQRYEPVQPQFLVAMAARLRDTVFFDIGANIGAYCILVGGRETFSEVLAFEPNPFCYAELERNVALNQLRQKIRCLEVALSDREGTAVFGFTSRFGGDGGLQETHLFSHLLQSEAPVTLQRLDTVFPGKDRMVALKIDVEGHELNVLKGAERVLSENRGVLQIEIHDASPQKADTLALLGRLGWSPVVRIGADHYFSNLAELQGDRGRLDLVEEALALVVHDSLHGKRPARRPILPGLTLELSYRYAQKLKALLKTLRLRR